MLPSQLCATRESRTPGHLSPSAIPFMEKEAPTPAEVDRKRKESRIAFTLLAILVAAGGIGYGIYYWTDMQADRQALIQLSESIKIDSSGRAADKQSRE